MAFGFGLGGGVDLGGSRAAPAAPAAPRPELVKWLAWLDTCSAKDHATTACAACVGAGLVGWTGWLGSMKSSLQSYTHRVGTQRVTAAEVHAEGASTRTRDSAWVTVLQEAGDSGHSTYALSALSDVNSH